MEQDNGMLHQHVPSDVGITEGGGDGGGDTGALLDESLDALIASANGGGKSRKRLNKEVPPGSGSSRRKRVVLLPGPRLKLKPRLRLKHSADCQRASADTCLQARPCPTGRRRLTRRRSEAGAPEGADAEERGMAAVLRDFESRESEREERGMAAVLRDFEARESVHQDERGIAAVLRGLETLVPNGEAPVRHLGPTATQDNEGRAWDLGHVVVDFTAVGKAFGRDVLGRGTESGPGDLFDYEGVRRCCRYLIEERALSITGLIMRSVWEADTDIVAVPAVPEDIMAMCQHVEFVPQVFAGVAQRARGYNCRFISNTSYRDLCKAVKDAACRTWMECCHEILQVGFFFDTELGTFETLEGNCAIRLLASEAQQKHAEPPDLAVEERGSRKEAFPRGGA